jgi:hypothetical protein
MASGSGSNVWPTALWIVVAPSCPIFRGVRALDANGGYCPGRADDRVPSMEEVLYGLLVERFPGSSSVMLTNDYSERTLVRKM